MRHIQNVPCINVICVYTHNEFVVAVYKHNYIMYDLNKNTYICHYISSGIGMHAAVTLSRKLTTLLHHVASYFMVRYILENEYSHYT